MFRNIKNVFKNSDNENIELIRNSKYFDESYYRLECPKLKGDPCRHYYYYGWKEGKSPSYEFSNNFYLKNYKDVEDAGINPLLHYLKFGKAENRIIEKDNGFSLKKIYEKLYDCPYYYKTYVYNTNVRRVNLFFDEINDLVCDMTLLFDFILNFCKKENYQLRIIYNMADFEILKEFLNKNKFVLPIDTVFLNLKSSNYLEIGLNEKYICTSWKTAKALLNTASMNNKIYFYLSNLDDSSKVSYYQNSNTYYNSKVVCLLENKKIVKNLKKCKLKFEINNKSLKLKKTNQLYCDFSDMFIVGVELLNEAFLKGVLNPEEWMVNIIGNNSDFKFHFDTGVRIRNVSKIDEYANFIFQLSYHKKEVTYEMPAVIGYVEENEYKKKEVFDLSNLKCKDIIDDINKIENTKIDNDYYEFEKSLNKIKE